MSLSRREFTKEFKLAAVRRLEMAASIAEVARASEFNANVLHCWRDYGDGVDCPFPGLGKKKAEEIPWPNWSGKLVSRRWRTIFEACLAASRGGADAAGAPGNRAIYPQIGKEVDRKMAITVVQMCRTAAVGQAGSTEAPSTAETADRDMDLRDEIQKIALQVPAYGRRRHPRTPHRGTNRYGGLPAMDPHSPATRRTMVLAPPSPSPRPPSSGELMAPRKPQVFKDSMVLFREGAVVIDHGSIWSDAFVADSLEGLWLAAPVWPSMPQGP